MKFLILAAIVALVSAAPVEEKKPAQDEKKDEKHGLVWPLPDHQSEGDLMLHGAISYDRVRELHKAKVEDDVDKMVLAHGRQLLRKINDFLDKNGDFKVPSIICKDSRNLNNTDNRWRIEIPKQQAPPAASDALQQTARPVENNQAGKETQRDQPVAKDQQAEKPAEDAAAVQHGNNTESENATSTAAPSTAHPGASDSPAQSSSVAPGSSSAPGSSAAPAGSTQPSSVHPGSSTTAKPADAASLAPEKEHKEEEKKEEKERSFEERRHEFNEQVGSNFARLLLKEFHKEQLDKEESDYLAHWVSDEAVHYGAMAIYCHEGENVKEIKKQITSFLEEKAQ